VSVSVLSLLVVVRKDVLTCLAESVGSQKLLVIHVHLWENLPSVACPVTFLSQNLLRTP